MDKFTWKEEYSVGVPSIDGQHKIFFDITNDLIALAQRPDVSRPEIQAVAKQLGDYTLSHFKTEEHYFGAVGYFDAARHVKAHDSHRRKVLEFIDRLDDPACDARAIAQELAVYSMRWLVEHVLFEDKKYAPFFKAHGVE
jgi:hemerythrin